MDTRLTNEEIIRSWQIVTDSYLLTALTKDMEEYPPSVRAIIEEEAMERGLVTRERDRDSQYVFGAKAIAWKQRMNSGAKRRFAGGAIAAIVLTGSGIFLTVKYSYIFSVGLWYSCWWVLFLFVPTILLAIYALALLMKKLRIVRWIYGNRWRVFTLCLLFSIVFIMKISRDLAPQGPWSEVAPHVFFNVISLSIYFGVLSFFLAMGLKGLGYRSESGNTVTR